MRCPGRTPSIGRSSCRAAHAILTDWYVMASRRQRRERRTSGSLQRNRTVAGADANGAPALAETAAQVVLPDVARHIRERQVAHVDSTIASVRVELGAEPVRHFDRDRAVAR